MPATDPEPTSMEEPRALEDEEGSSASIPSPVPPSTPLLDPTTTRPESFPSETTASIETKAVSVVSNECSSVLSSPAEASPAKPAATPPAAFEGAVEMTPATSRIASASDSLIGTGASLVSASEPPPPPSSPSPVLPSTTYGNPGVVNNFPTLLTFKGISVTLENNSVWKQFYGCGTEMILTKPGRRMFPYCRYRLSGLDPERQYSLVLSIVPSDQYRYRWSSTKWEITGPAEHQGQGLIRAFSHHYSPSLGSEWMGTLVSFYKLKLTNHPQDLDGHINLHSMHRYIPRLHVIPVPDGDVPTPAQPVVMGPESMTFTFPQTEFMAVTTYQNFRITQLKINHNPFAKGFREDGNNPRLIRVATESQPMVLTDTRPSVEPSEKKKEEKEEVVDLSTKTPTVSAPLSKERGTRLVLKPIMSTSSTKDDPYVHCLRGKHALGELVLVQTRSPLLEPKEEPEAAVAVTPSATSTPLPPPLAPGSSPGYHKRRKRINRRWSNSRGREWKAAAAAAAAAPTTVFHSPSLTVAMQPELDDVEGLLFVSFTSKEALEVHVGDKPANSTPAASPISTLTPMQWREKDVIPETDEEKIARSEAVLLQDLRVLKHRQVIHPVLQEVGMKLSSLDPMKSIDLQYLRVRLPLPPPNLPEESKAGALSPGDKGLSFMSRTGKTSDMTKIKGWRNKFIRNKDESPSKCDGSQKNLSAFCSNMLDEYLESEAQYISERAAAFSTNSEDSVAYRLPVKGSSYVKTLDSVLKHRKAASKFPTGANRPCPLSHKPLLYSALSSPAPPLASPESSPAGVQSTQPQPAAQRLSTYLPGLGQRPAGSFGQSHAMTHRITGLTKFQRTLMEMEHGAQNQGLNRTQLTTERLSVALAGLLTKQMLPSQIWKVTKYPKYKTTGPECGQEFCTLGCVCSSLQHLNRAPFHCRRPECMFGCACFKRKITKQLSAGEREALIQPVYSMTNMEHMVQPHPGSHANRLWNRVTHEVDPEPLFTPKAAPPCLAPVKKRTSGARLTQPIREEDKDPVYKYLESMMTCARVREFNSKPPPELTIEPKILDVSALTTKPQKTTSGDLPKKSLLVKKAGRVSEGIASGEKEAKKQIEIQSACKWVKDRKMVLEALCQRMNQNRLSRRFWVGPYRIHPVAKIFMKKPSGAFVTYRLHISKPSKASDTDEDDFEDSEEEKQPDKSLDGDVDAEEDDRQNGESGVRFGVTPFLSGVLPAGRLKARTKPVGCQAYGLIQVNGKSYNQARLLLGNMGSLHPANRLAAFVTGRLHPPGGVSLKVSRKSDSTNKITTPDAVHIKAAGTVVPPVTAARKSTDLKPPKQPPAGQIFPPDFWTKGSINAVDPFLSGLRSSVRPFQNSSTSSPVSLTVSPALKTPSFLGQSGTYSFRICPPANQGTGGQNLPGVTLPGGFTLIELPKHGADGAAETVNTTNTPGADKARPQKDAVVNFAHSAADSDANWLGLKTGAAAKDPSSSTSVEPGPSPEPVCDVKIPSEENDETNSRQVETNPDIASEDLSSDSDSDSSDYFGEADEDDEVVDIETVEEVRQGVAITEMKEAVRKALKESGDSSDGLGSTKELNVQDEMEDCKDNRRRKNHTVLERQRRSEQRTLFDKLQTVLKSDPRAPRLHILSLALKEIRNLVETSRCLEEKKRRLTRMQSVYVKELSLLSGKSDTLIRNKLKEICERQKVKEKTTQWKPFFSNLLQSRAALLQSAAPQSNLPPNPMLMPDFFRAPPQAAPPTNAAQNKLMSLLQSNLKRALTQSGTQPPKPPSASSASRVEVPGPAPSPQGGRHQKKPEEQREKPGAPAQVSVPTSQPECPVAATPLVTAAQDGASSSPSSSTPTSSTPPVKPAQFSLPLIRAKNGRIILPSSLKPLGHGFYTLMVMEPRKTGEEDDGSSLANNTPFDVESLVKQRDTGCSELDRLLDLGSNHISEKEKTVQASPSNPKRSGVTAPVAELALLNKSILVPSVALQAVKSGQGGGTAAGLNKTPPTACLSFNRVKPIPAAEPEPSPPVVRRCRGRPRKPRKPPVTPSKKHKVVKDAGKRETSLDEERQNKKLTSEVTKTRAGGSPGEAGDDPVPVKRGKGRPPKKKCAQLWSPPVAQAGSAPPDSKEDGPVRLSRGFKSPDSKPKEGPAKTPPLRNVNASRPMTRGALGKDFPSAKKRSWIDVEKELEPELESEPESE